MIAHIIVVCTNTMYDEIADLCEAERTAPFDGDPAHDAAEEGGAVHAVQRRQAERRVEGLHEPPAAGGPASALPCPWDPGLSAPELLGLMAAQPSLCS